MFLTPQRIAILSPSPRNWPSYQSTTFQLQQHRHEPLNTPRRMIMSSSEELPQAMATLAIAEQDTPDQLQPLQPLHRSISPTAQVWKSTLAHPNSPTSIICLTSYASRSRNMHHFSLEMSIFRLENGVWHTSTISSSVMATILLITSTHTVHRRPSFILATNLAEKVSSHTDSSLTANTGQVAQVLIVVNSFSPPCQPYTSIGPRIPFAS